MTIIAIKGDTMAADSDCFNQHIRYPMVFQKISRGPTGLIGICGPTSDAYRIHLWFRNGESPEDKPSGLRIGEEGIEGLILRPDGSVWHFDERLLLTPSVAPATTGVSNACIFAEGAMAFGATAEQAVRLAIEHCTHVGGPVQVERIG